MTTKQDLIAQLRALGIPDWATARVLMTQAADTLEALQAELDEWRFTNKIDELQRVNEGLRAEVARLKKLSVTNIMLAIVPGDGSGFEVYAKSVAEVEQKLSDMGGELEDWQLGIKRHHMLQEIIDKRKAALARLAGLEAQFPAIVSALEWGASLIRKEYEVGHNGADSYLMNYSKLGERVRLSDHRKWVKTDWRWIPEKNTAAGASPVEPSQEQPPAPSDAAREYMTGYSDCKEWAQPSQYGSAELQSLILAKLTQPNQAVELSADDVRAAGGIVHSDGNIFFTNIGKLNAAINAKGATP